MPPLQAETQDISIHKGVAADDAGYSGFASAGLANRLKELQVARVGVCGIATEFCVRATALDGIQAGFETTVLIDRIRAVQPSETLHVLTELAKAGVKVRTAAEWLKSL